MRFVQVWFSSWVFERYKKKRRGDRDMKTWRRKPHGVFDYEKCSRKPNYCTSGFQVPHKKPPQQSDSISCQEFCFLVMYPCTLIFAIHVQLFYCRPYVARTVLVNGALYHSGMVVWWYGGMVVWLVVWCYDDIILYCMVHYTQWGVSIHTSGRFFSDFKDGGLNSLPESDKEPFSCKQ